MAKSKMDLRREAQDIIMSAIADSPYRFEVDELPDEEKAVMIEEIRKQADRVAKMFGFEKSWFN